MKPTCPIACPLKKKIEEQKRSEETLDEIRELYDEATPFQRQELLALANFLYYRHKGLTQFSTWIEMFERQRILYFIWGFFVKIDGAMILGRW
jgi:hypothetical protein